MSFVKVAGLISCGLLALTSGCAPSAESFNNAPVCANNSTYILQGTVDNRPLEGTTVTGGSSSLVPGATSTFTLLGTNGITVLMQLSWSGQLADDQIGTLTSANAFIENGFFANMRLCANSGLIRLRTGGGGQVVLRGLSLSAGTCGAGPALSGEVKACFK